MVLVLFCFCMTLWFFYYETFHVEYYSVPCFYFFCLGSTVITSLGKERAGLDAFCLSWLGPEVFCLLLGPPGFNCWFSFVCSSVPIVLFDAPGISRCRSQHAVSVESSSLVHHSVYLWFICFPWWSINELKKPSSGPNNYLYVLNHNRSWRQVWDPVKPG